jgi:hypothetical protein
MSDSYDMKINGNGHAAQHRGRLFWSIELPDGGYVTTYADRAEIIDGHLLFHGASYAISGGRIDYENPKGPELVLLAFAPGHWAAYYAAGLLDGTPVSVDKWAVKKPIS